jgi:hypothetical protein
MNAWMVILAAGLGSYLFRLSMIVLAGRITMPAYLEQASGLVAPAAGIWNLAATGNGSALTWRSRSQTLCISSMYLWFTSVGPLMFAAPPVTPTTPWWNESK